MPAIHMPLVPTTCKHCGDPVSYLVGARDPKHCLDCYVECECPDSLHGEWDTQATVTDAELAP